MQAPALVVPVTVPVVLYCAVVIVSWPERVAEPVTAAWRVRVEAAAVPAKLTPMHWVVAALPGSRLVMVNSAVPVLVAA